MFEYQHTQISETSIAQMFQMFVYKMAHLNASKNDTEFDLLLKWLNIVEFEQL